MNITVKKEDLLTALNKNREQHTAIFDEALAGYKKKAIELLEQHIEEIRGGKVVAVKVVLPVPLNHTRDYDRIIKMVEMDVNDVFELEEYEFARYVMDDWDWKQAFLTTNAPYSMTAMKYSREAGS